MDEAAPGVSATAAVDKVTPGGSAAVDSAAPGGSAAASLPAGEVCVVTGPAGEEEFHLPTDPCLGEWKDKEGMFPTLSDLFPSGHEFTLQVLDVGITDQGKPTGWVRLTDGVFWLWAKLGLEGTRRRTEYIDWLKNQRVGVYSLIKVQETIGSPNSLIIVSFNVGHSNILSFILFQAL